MNQFACAVQSHKKSKDRLPLISKYHEKRMARNYVSAG